MQQQIRPAQQTRSQQTMDRIIEAAEELVRQTANPDFTVREICSRAGASQSSFYSRFPEKSALLHLLVDRLAARGFEASDGLRGLHRADMPFEAFAHEAFDVLVSSWNRESGIVRAILAAEAANPGLRLAREKMDEQLVTHSLDVIGDLYPGTLNSATRARFLERLPVIASAFRGATADLQPFGSAAEGSHEHVVDGLLNLCLSAIAAE